MFVLVAALQSLSLTAQPSSGYGFAALSAVRHSSLICSTISIPIVLVHGMPGCRQDFDPLVDILRKRGNLNCLTLDLPGHGASPMLIDGREPDDLLMAQNVWATVDAAVGESNEPVLLLGHSAGGHTVLEAAALRPEQTAGVALIASVGIRPHQAIGNEVGFRQIVQPLAELSQQPPWRTLFRVAFELVLRLSALLSGPQRMTADELLHTQRRTGLYDFTRAAANAEALASPVLHAYACDDPIIQAERSIELVALLDRDARHHGPRLCWQQGGHYVQQTHASELADALEAWTRELTRRESVYRQEGTGERNSEH